MLVRILNEDDFNKVLAREVCDVDGIYFRVSHWIPEFREEVEPLVILVWVSLLGYPLISTQILTW